MGTLGNAPSLIKYRNVRLQTPSNSEDSSILSNSFSLAATKFRSPCLRVVTDEQFVRGDNGIANAPDPIFDLLQTPVVAALGIDTT